MGEPRFGSRRPARLVGREAEAGALCDLVAAASAGDGGAVFVTGEGGVGKSRLADRAAAAAQAAGVGVLRGRAVRSGPAGCPALRPFAEALLGLARTGWSPPPRLEPYAGMLGRLVPDWRRGALLPAAVPAEPYLHGEAVLRVLAAAPADAYVLVLEDLNDADPHTLAALEYLVDNLAGQAVAVIGTLRDVPGPAADLAHYARRRDPAALLPLARLDRSATAELVAALLGAQGRPVPAGLCDAVFRQSGGNPLAVTELLRGPVLAGAAPGGLVPAPWRPLHAPREGEDRAGVAPGGGPAPVRAPARSATVTPLTPRPRRPGPYGPAARQRGERAPAAPDVTAHVAVAAPRDPAAAPGARPELLTGGAHVPAPETMLLTGARGRFEAGGAVVEDCHLRLALAVDALLRARFADAEELLAAAWRDIARLRLPALGSYALAVRALVPAHRGRQAELRSALADFDRWRGTRKDEVPLVTGLGLAVCALLHGATAAARTHLKGLDGTGAATPSYLCGQYGLGLLVETVHGAATRADHDALACHAAGRLPWNSQFVHLSRAVLAGRAGDTAGAEQALAQALAASAPFPLARHLGLLLVAPAAARDGWGDPARSLQEGESFFTAHGIHSAARHCRDLLRGLGEPVRQRRHGSAGVPRRLWLMGVTVREHEVLVQLARHRTNREIAADLHISPRTVERHVANLLAKTGGANRRDLAVLTAPERDAG
ncbi:AAA family ATPase [Streptomyces sp. CA2R106]|uniref:AAA family ATPase n=1 Tax=Streptomyces sp. CA2R106 TaxID=3120153 RepID=UPI00300989B5